MTGIWLYGLTQFVNMPARQLFGFGGAQGIGLGLPDERNPAYLFRRM